MLIRKNNFYILIINSILAISVSAQPIRQPQYSNSFVDLSCEALIDSIRSKAIAETNIETVEWKSLWFIQALITKNDICLPYLIDVLRNSRENWKLRFITVEIIPQISKTFELAEELANILKDEGEHPYLRGVCALSLGYIGRKEYVPLLIQPLKDESIYVRERTIWGLDLLNDPRAIQPLIECLDDSYYMVQVLAIQTLGHLKAEEAIEPLKGKLDADDLPQYSEVVKHKIIRAISDIGGSGARAVLLNVLTEERYGKLRVLAAEELRNYKDEEVVNALLDALNDFDERLQLRAAKALMKITPITAKSAIEQLFFSTESVYLKSEIQKLLEGY